jgi:hypothetical protein
LLGATALAAAAAYGLKDPTGYTHQGINYVKDQWQNLDKTKLNEYAQQARDYVTPYAEKAHGHWKTVTDYVQNRAT